MALSNFPSGFTHGIMIRGVPLIQTHPGKVFWVDNSTTGLLPGVKSGSNGNEGSFNAPFSTVAYAVTQCRANKGDIVFVKPGHAETITASTAWGLAGCAVVGLGQGTARPTFTFSATASKITLTANNQILHNLLFISSIDAVVNVLNVTGTDCVLSQLEYREDTQVQCTDCIIANAANRLVINGFVYRAFDTTAGTVAGIALIATDSVDISDLDVIGLWSAGFIDCRTTASTNLRVYNVKQYRSLGTGEILVKDTITGSTGMIGPNINARLSANTTNITEVVTGATFVVMGGTSTAGVGGNTFLVANLAGEQGMAINWTNSTDA
jgi:hypothetical protein